MNPYISPSTEANPQPHMRDIAKIIIEYDVKPFTAMPPLHRLMWRFGLEVRPPMYSSFSEFLIITGIPTVVMWVCVMRFFAWQDNPWMRIIVAGLVFGCLVIPLTWWSLTRIRKKKDLPDWDELVDLAKNRESIQNET